MNARHTRVQVCLMSALKDGVAIALAVLGLNLMGDGLRDVLDPRLARQR